MVRTATVLGTVILVLHNYQKWSKAVTPQLNQFGVRGQEIRDNTYHRPTSVIDPNGQIIDWHWDATTATMIHGPRAPKAKDAPEINAGSVRLTRENEKYEQFGAELITSILASISPTVRVRIEAQRDRFDLIIRTNDCLDLWRLLGDVCGTASSLHVQTLNQSYEEIRLASDENVYDFFPRSETACDAARAAGKTITDLQQLQQLKIAVKGVLWFPHQFADCIPPANPGAPLNWPSYTVVRKRIIDHMAEIEQCDSVIRAGGRVDRQEHRSAGQLSTGAYKAGLSKRSTSAPTRPRSSRSSAATALVQADLPSYANSYLATNGLLKSSRGASTPRFKCDRNGRPKPFAYKAAQARLGNQQRTTQHFNARSQSTPFSRTKSNTEPCNACGQHGHKTYDCPKRLTIKCWICDGIGHMSKYCRSKGFDNSDKVRTRPNRRVSPPRIRRPSIYRDNAVRPLNPTAHTYTPTAQSNLTFAPNMRSYAAKAPPRSIAANSSTTVGLPMQNESNYMSVDEESDIGSVQHAFAASISFEDSGDTHNEPQSVCHCDICTRSRDNNNTSESTMEQSLNQRWKRMNLPKTTYTHRYTTSRPGHC
ncbi:hypothetical protein B484DRAFT_431455, partial [Ochromonadaceae sp. CCMP2298]